MRNSIVQITHTYTAVSLCELFPINMININKYECRMPFGCGYFHQTVNNLDDAVDIQYQALYGFHDSPLSMYIGVISPFQT